MLRRFTLFGVVVTLLGASRLSEAEPAAPDVPSHSVLAGVDALRQPVTFAETKIPLGELVQKVAKTTGVRLYAAREVADEPLAVVVEKMPAVRLLDEIAKFLDYRWIRDGKTGVARYLLFQDSEQKKSEQAIRNAARQNEEDRMQATVAAYAAVGRLSDTEYRDARLANNHSRHSPPTADEDRYTAALLACENSAQRAMARLLGQLLPQDWNTLQEGTALSLYSNPRDGERALPDGVAASLVAFQPSASAEGLQAFYPPEAINNIQGFLAQKDGPWSRAEGVRVVVRRGRAEVPDNGTGAPQLTVTATPLAAPMPTAGDPASARETISLCIRPINEQPGWDDDPPERQAALAKNEVFNSKKPFQPQLPPLPKLRSEQARQVSELLPEIGRTYGVSLLADSYLSAPIPEPSKTASKEPISLRTLLTRLTRLPGSGLTYYRWDRHEDLVLLRSRTWFYDRPGEVPLRLLRQWEKQFTRNGELSLDELADAMTALTDDQFDVLNTAIGNRAICFEVAPFVSDSDRAALRLYGMLPDSYRQRLQRGGTVPPAALTGGPLNLFLSILTDAELDSATRLTRADAARAAMYLSAMPRELLRWEHDDAVSQKDAEPRADPRSVFKRKPAPGKATDVDQPWQITRFPILQAKLGFHWGTGSRDSEVLVVAP